jgi:hypothetical protein
LLSDLVIEDITRAHELEKTFLRECYCHSGALSQYSVISKEILKARYAALFDNSNKSPVVTSAVNKDGISSELIAETLSGRPILLIGDTGVGKTTFIRNLIRVEAESIFDNSIVFYIDLGSKATLTENIKDFIINDITSQLRDNFSTDIYERNLVRGVYHAELSRFAKGIYSDLKDKNPDMYLDREIAFLNEKIGNKEEHLKSVLSHMSKSWKKQLIFIIDNADQRDELVQQTAFLISQEFAKHWPVIVFVALRPETFHRSIQIGALSGYHPKAFTISPPRIDLVLKGPSGTSVGNPNL